MRRQRPSGRQPILLQATVTRYPSLALTVLVSARGAVHVGNPVRQRCTGAIAPFSLGDSFEWVITWFSFSSNRWVRPGSSENFYSVRSHDLFGFDQLVIGQVTARLADTNRL